MRIGLFDSGVGGLTVLKTLLNKYPLNEYIYYGDTLNVPYGNKSKEELLKVAKNNIDFLLNKHVDIIIVACGTVSSNCLKELKASYHIPIYSILEPTITYLNTKNYNNIGVIATQATINSHIFRDSIPKQVYEIATPKLVPLIENNELANIENVLVEYLNPYLNKIDVLVLGCTHYPIIKKQIKDLVKKIDLLDMADLVTLNNGQEKRLEIYFSKIDNTIIENTKRILNDDTLTIHKI